MRILAVTNLYPNPLQPNRATFNDQQFRSIAAKCPLAVVSPIAWTDELRARLSKSRRAMGSRHRVAANGVSVDHPRYVFPPKLLRDWYGHFFQASVKATFFKVVRDFRPDVVLASWAYPDGWAAVRLARQAGLPVVVKVHGSDVLTLTGKPGRRALTAAALRQADGVIAVSRDLVARVMSLGVAPEKVRLVYNGVDTGVFHPGSMIDARSRLGIDANSRVVLFVGNLVHVKGLDVLVKACAMLVARGVRFTCYLVGEGSLRAMLEQQVAAAELENVVKFVGAKAHRELPDWFRAADVLVLPSRSEGVPNVLLEACACGTRFVASRVGGIPEIAERGEGRLVPAKDDAALADGIAEMLENPRAASDAGNGNTWRSHDTAATEVIGFLEQVASIGRPHNSH